MLKAGAARVVITPPVGTEIAGYFAPRTSVGVHDDLHANALVLDDGTTRLAIVSCDLLSVRRTTVRAVREIVERETGIPGANVLINTTHVHTGPYTSRLMDGGLDPAVDALLPRYIAGAVTAAARRCAEAQVAVGVGSVEGVAFNRRFRMRGGGFATNPGIGNPEIVEPLGPIDPELVVIRVTRPDGSLMAAVVNYTLHSDVVNGDEFSADWGGALGTCLRRQYGDDVVVLVCNGACGDINHLNVNGGRDQFGHRHAAWIGRVLAGEAIRVIEQSVPVPDPTLACAAETVMAPLRTVTPEQLVWASATLDAAAKRAEQAEAAYLSSDIGSSTYIEECYARMAIAVHEARLTEPEIAVEVQAMRIGGAGIAAIPAELFVEPGLEIKQGSGLKPTCVVGYANGMAGYVPTRIAFEQGGYEPRLATSSRLVPEAAEMIVEAALKALQRAG